MYFLEQKNSNRGSTLAFAMLIILLILMFSSTLVTMLKRETKWGLKHRRSTTAFHLAEAAIDRALWKLKESKDVWNSVAEGAFDSEYQGGKEFTDVEGGKYKITVSTTTEDNQYRIIGVGRDSSTDEMRSIEVIVKNVATESAVTAPNLYMQGGVIVHWGPVQSTTQMDLTGAAAGRYYPRKYSVGQINPRDTDPYDDDNTDDIEYWAYDEDVPDPPEIDFDYYLDNADEYYGPPDPDHEWETPTGGVPHTFNNEVVDYGSDDKIYYVNGDCTLKNSFMKGTLIVTGNLNFNGGGKGLYPADVPENAWEEYAVDDTVAINQYPGDTGLQQNAATYTITAADGKVSFQGFIYIGGNWHGTGGQNVNGCVQCVGSMAGLTGNVAVFYNEDIASQVEIVDLNLSRVSWREIKPAW